MLSLVLSWQVVLILLVPLVIARDNNQRSNCIANLRQLEDAKAQWAAKTKAQPAAVPHLLPFLISGYQPTCPANGTYTLGAINEPPRCSHADRGHTLASSP